jgi:two-component system, OmpR family, response regulator
MNKLLLMTGVTAMTAQFRKCGHLDVEGCTDTRHLYELLRKKSYQAAILDAVVTGAETIEICRQVRACNRGCALIVLNANCGQFNQARLINAGVDLCFSDPVNAADLLERINSVLQLRNPVKTQAQLNCGHVRLDVHNRVAFSSETTIKLRPTEFILLEFLMRNQGTVFSPEELSTQVRKRKSGACNSVRTQINSLRKKTRHHDGEMIIHTIHGRGYMMSSRSPFLLNRASCI